ncbi:MAG: single-stranded-DNA-specific exonuclease RecJ [Deltaproteobacteria bacterium]|nr:single-stranded-DNA-specific exonuclease RecJ [Deltaproteobacteria bacterium]
MPLGKTWNIKPASSFASFLSRQAGITPLQAQLLINRGISEPEEADFFMNPRLSNIPDPMNFKGMKEALFVILRCIETGAKITIFGDYDADGLTSTALLENFFSNLGIKVSHYIPDRLKEGYGLNSEAIKRIAGDGTKLIITVDCGISNGKEISLAISLGMDVIITDHHQIPEGFQPVCPVVNPNQKDCLFPFKNLAGVGIAFFLSVAIRAALREKGLFRINPEPDLREYLDLVALGTVADRVPLLDQNRILVASGMETMSRSRWAGLVAMMEVADISPSGMSSEDIAFRLAPRLNAPGRIGNPETGIKLLTVKDPLYARELAFDMDRTNETRQSLEKDIFCEIEEIIRSEYPVDKKRVLVFSGENWHRGVLGIVASRLVERYHRPSIIMNIQDGMAVGSGRSMHGFDLFGALSQISHVFERFGGHKYAAGFALKSDRVDFLRKELERIALLPEAGFKDEDMVPRVEIDSELALKEINFEMVRHIRALSPFGEGNPEPLFLARSLKVHSSRIIRDRHLSMRVGQGKTIFDAIGFNFSDTCPSNGESVDMVFTPEVNFWQGHERIKLRITDLKRAV